MTSGAVVLAVVAGVVALADQDGQELAVRPAHLAARPSPGLPVVVTCNNADVQVTCGEVRHFLAGPRPGCRTLACP